MKYYLIKYYLIENIDSILIQLKIKIEKKYWNNIYIHIRKLVNITFFSIIIKKHPRK